MHLGGMADMTANKRFDNGRASLIAPEGRSNEAIDNAIIYANVPSG